jgi:hypothetical protein
MPPPRRLPWPVKPLASAQTRLGYDDQGRMVMDIVHDVVKGLAPADVAWWFANIAGDIEIDGATMPRYLAWHPNDHIHWELAAPGQDGGASVGARFRIVEAFGRDPAHYIDVVEQVTRLDASGITLVGTVLGQQVSTLRHDFSPVTGGTRYVSRLTVGVDLGGAGRLVNRVLHGAVFSAAKGHAWLRHNVEEVGLLEHIVPLLQRQQRRAAAA